jgi:hypothetical protein
MAKVIDHGMAKPDDPIYTSGPVVGGVRFGGQQDKPKKSKPTGNSLREAIAAITPEQAEQQGRTMARLRAEAMAKGQDPMQPYADANEEILMGPLSRVYLDENDYKADG